MPASIYIVDTVNQDRILLQNVPQAIKVDPKTNHHVIRAQGANNPKYHYTGAEDIIMFTTTFYSNRDDRADVVEVCRKIEALTKNDSFTGKKHEVLLMWGNSLFNNFRFLLLETEYVWKNFDGEYDGYPRGAEMKLVFARITDKNLSHDEIRTTITPQKT